MQIKTLFSRVISRLFPHAYVRKGKRVKIERGAKLSTVRGGHIDIGDHSIIRAGAIVDSAGGFITIGSHCSINQNCGLFGHGGLTIGNDTRIAIGTYIIAANHCYDTPRTLIREQGLSKLGITIGNDVWIGAGVRIVDGVTIADGCVIGAGAVVTKNTEAYGVYAGNPAERIKERNA